jgi:hypothetical protein
MGWRSQACEYAALRPDRQRVAHAAEHEHQQAILLATWELADSEAELGRSGECTQTTNEGVCDPAALCGVTGSVEC